MKTLVKTLPLFFAASLLVQCGKKEPYTDHSRDLQDEFQAITEILVHDIFSPPVAARVYAYTATAAYEVVAQSHSDYRSLAGQFHDFPTMPAAPQNEAYVPEIAALHAAGIVSKALVFSEDRMEAHMEGLMTKLSKHHGQEALETSQEYGATVAAAVL